MFTLSKGLYLLAFIASWYISVDVSAEEMDKYWWKKTIVYQIYPRSFQDSNGDGVGDLNGITSRLDYIKSLGVDTIWLSPIYVSPMADFGYDIADHKQVDPIFGTNDDLTHLIEEVHKRDMYIVLDYVPNHTSDKHPWFEASQRFENPYRDFYRWHEGVFNEDGTRSPPNNWISIFGGSAWEWDEERQQYYLHQFLKEQPDLNYREPLVRKEMESVLRLLLDMGVDGFRVDAIQTLFEVDNVEIDEPLSHAPGYSLDEHESLLHPYTLHLDEIHEVTREWRGVLDQYEKETGKHPFMVMEVYSWDMDDLMKYYHSGADMPFNFGFIPINASCDGTCFRDITKQWMDAMPDGLWPNFVLGNHDNRRVTTRKGAQYAVALNTILLLLPGTPTTYMGEEIGQLDIPTLSIEDTQDPWGARLGEEYIEKYSRDPCRAPFQWNGDKNAGFSTADKTWLPVHADYEQLNVQVQDEIHGSVLTMYRQTSHLRRIDAFQNSNIQFTVVNEDIFSFLRYEEYDFESVYLIIANLGDNESMDDYTTILDKHTYTQGKVVQSNFMTNGEIVDLKSISVDIGEMVVLKLQATDTETKTEL